jgi:nucleotide-binding universal stress UspA family protein
MYQNILVPLDGSKLAECVFAHMDALARGCLVKTVTLVQAVEPYQYPTYGGEMTVTSREIEEINTANKLQARAYLQKAADGFKYENVDVRWEMLIGRAAEALADYAAKKKMDLILIATHGRTGVSRWVWGSVADRLLRAACTPILMVRAPGCFPGL